MSGIRFVEVQVFDPVVGAHVVDVMHDFLVEQRSAKVVRHDQSVLKHVALRIGHRVLSADFDSNVATDMTNAAAAPTAVIFLRQSSQVLGVAGRRAEVMGALRKQARSSGNVRGADMTRNDNAFDSAHGSNCTSPNHCDDCIQSQPLGPIQRAAAREFFGNLP